MVINAALSGLGIALLPEVLITQELASGQLITCPMPHYHNPITMVCYTLRYAPMKTISAALENGYQRLIITYSVRVFS